MQDTPLLLAHAEDLVRKAQKTGVAHSKFLTAAEAAAIQTAYATRRDITCTFDGGFTGAERRIAVFTQPDWGSYNREEALAGLAIAHRPQDILRHQDILGAILGLGLSRDVLGDILTEPGSAKTVCLAPMAGFITQHLQKAGRVGVSVQPLALSALPQLADALTEKQASVASLRLDAVVAAAFNLSRTAAADAIRAGGVQLAHRECLDPARTVSQEDIFSLRGKGRAKLLAIKDFSRKGKQRILLGLYT